MAPHKKNLKARSSQIGNNAECAACMSRDCECGYGPPATTTFVEQAEQDVYYESHQTPVLHGTTFSGVRTLYPKRSAGRIAMSEDGSLLAAFGQKKKMASIWSTGDSLEEIYSFESSKVISDVSFGLGFVAWASGQSVLIWDMVFPPNASILRQGSNVLTVGAHAEMNILSCMDLSGVEYWRVRPNETERLGKISLEPLNSDRIRSSLIEFQPGTANSLIAAAIGNKILLLEMDTELIVGTIDGHNNPIVSLSWNRDGSFLTSASEDSVKVWDMRNSTPRTSSSELKSMAGNAIRSAIFHPVIPDVVVLAFQKSVELWTPRHTTHGHKTKIADADGSSSHLSAGGEILACCSGDVIKLWQ